MTLMEERLLAELEAVEDDLEGLTEAEYTDPLEIADAQLNHLPTIRYALTAGMPVTAWGPARKNANEADRVARATRSWEEGYRRLLAELAGGTITLDQFRDELGRLFKRQARNSYLAGRRALGDLSPLTVEELDHIDELTLDAEQSMDQYLRNEVAAGGVGSLLVSMVLDPTNYLGSGLPGDPWKEWPAPLGAGVKSPEKMAAEALKDLAKGKAVSEEKVAAAVKAQARLLSKGKPVPDSVAKLAATSLRGPAHGVDAAKAMADFERRMDQYGNTVRSMGPAGELGALTNSIPAGSALVWWTLGPADHCIDCVRLSDASPFYADLLETNGLFPASGHTRCGGNCHCHLEYDVPTEVCTDPLSGSGSLGDLGITESDGRVNVWVQEASTCSNPVSISSLTDALGMPDHASDRSFQWDEDLATSVKGRVSDSVTGADIRAVAANTASPGVRLAVRAVTTDPEAFVRILDRMVGHTMNPVDELRVLRLEADGSVFHAFWSEAGDVVRLEMGATTAGLPTLDTDLTLRAINLLAERAAAAGKRFDINGEFANDGMKRWLDTLGAVHQPLGGTRATVLPDFGQATDILNRAPRASDFIPDAQPFETLPRAEYPNMPTTYLRRNTAPAPGPGSLTAGARAQYETAGTTEQLAAFRTYRRLGYHSVNRELRGLPPPDRVIPTATLIAQLDALTATVPLPEETFLYRSLTGLEAFDRPDIVALGAHPERLPEARAALEGMVGRSFTDPAFMSTTIDPTMWPYPVVMQIRAPEGTPAFFAGARKAFRGEQEVLLARNQRYRIVGVTERTIVDRGKRSQQLVVQVELERAVKAGIAPEVAMLPEPPKDLGNLFPTTTQLGGVQQKLVLMDDDFGEWLVKYGDQPYPVAISRFADEAGLHVVPVRQSSYANETATVQYVVPGESLAKRYATATDPDVVTRELLGNDEWASELVGQQMLDHVTSNYDNHLGNFILDDHGHLWGIDKANADVGFLLEPGNAEWGAVEKAFISPVDPVSRAFSKTWALDYIRPEHFGRWLESFERVDAKAAFAGLPPAERDLIVARIASLRDDWTRVLDDYIDKRVAQGTAVPDDWLAWRQSHVFPTAPKAGPDPARIPDPALHSNVPAEVAALPAWPDGGRMKLEPSVKLEGSATKQVLVDPSKRLWLFKPGESAPVFESAAADVGHALGLRLPPVRVAEFDGKVGSLQPIVPGHGLEKDTVAAAKALTPDQQNDLAAMSILDLLIANMDYHPGQWFFDSSERLWAIDKGLAFAPVTVSSNLPGSFFRTENRSVFAAMVETSGIRNVSPADIAAVLDRLDGLTDEAYSALVQGTLKHIKVPFGSDADALRLLLDRKHKARAVWGDFYRKLVESAPPGKVSDAWRQWAKDGGVFTPPVAVTVPVGMPKVMPPLTPEGRAIPPFYASNKLHASEVGNDLGVWRKDFKVAPNREAAVTRLDAVLDASDGNVLEGFSNGQLNTILDRAEAMKSMGLDLSVVGRLTDYSTVPTADRKMGIGLTYQNRIALQHDHTWKFLGGVDSPTTVYNDIGGLFAHEYGHALYNALGSEGQTRAIRLWDRVKGTAGTDLSTYATKDAEEWWGEVIAAITTPGYKPGTLAYDGEVWSILADAGRVNAPDPAGLPVVAKWVPTPNAPKYQPPSVAEYIAKYSGKAKQSTFWAPPKPPKLKPVVEQTMDEFLAQEKALDAAMREGWYKMTDADREAIKAFKYEEEGSAVQATLRQHHPLPENLWPVAAGMDRVTTTPVPDGTILWRGVSKRVAEKFKVGTSVTDASWPPTTERQMVAAGFAKKDGALLRIRTKGVTGVRLDTEVVFQRGVKFEVRGEQTATLFGKKVRVIDVEAVGPLAVTPSTPVGPPVPAPDKTWLKQGDPQQYLVPGSDLPLNAPLVEWTGYIPPEPDLPTELLRKTPEELAGVKAARDAAFKTWEDVRDGKVKVAFSFTAADDKAAEAAGFHVERVGSEYLVTADPTNLDPFKAYIADGGASTDDAFWMMAGYSDADLDAIDAYESAKGGLRLTGGVVMVEPDGRLWLLAPRNEFAGYQNTHIKGGVDHGETAAKAAVREMREEAGFSVELDGYLGDYVNTDRTGMTRMYIGHRTGGGPLWAHQKETYEVRLVTPDEAKGLLTRYKKPDARDQRILVDAVEALQGKEPLEHFTIPANAVEDLVARTKPATEAEVWWPPEKVYGAQPKAAIAADPVPSVAFGYDYTAMKGYQHGAITPPGTHFPMYQTRIKLPDGTNQPFYWKVVPAGGGAPAHLFWANSKKQVADPHLRFTLHVNHLLTLADQVATDPSLALVRVNESLLDQIPELREMLIAAGGKPFGHQVEMTREDFLALAKAVEGNNPLAGVTPTIPAAPMDAVPTLIGASGVDVDFWESLVGPASVTYAEAPTLDALKMHSVSWTLAGKDKPVETFWWHDPQLDAVGMSMSVSVLTEKQYLATVAANVAHASALAEYLGRSAIVLDGSWTNQPGPTLKWLTQYNTDHLHGTFDKANRLTIDLTDAKKFLYEVEADIQQLDLNPTWLEPKDLNWVEFAPTPKAPQVGLSTGIYDPVVAGTMKFQSWTLAPTSFGWEPKLMGAGGYAKATIENEQTFGYLRLSVLSSAQSESNRAAFVARFLSHTADLVDIDPTLNEVYIDVLTITKVPKLAARLQADFGAKLVDEGDLLLTREQALAFRDAFNLENPVALPNYTGPLADNLDLPSVKSMVDTMTTDYDAATKTYLTGFAGITISYSAPNGRLTLTGVTHGKHTLGQPAERNVATIWRLVDMLKTNPQYTQLIIPPTVDIDPTIRAWLLNSGGVVKAEHIVFTRDDALALANDFLPAPAAATVVAPPPPTTVATLQMLEEGATVKVTFDPSAKVWGTGAPMHQTTFGATATTAKSSATWRRLGNVLEAHAFTADGGAPFGQDAMNAFIVKMAAIADQNPKVSGLRFTNVTVANPPQGATTMTGQTLNWLLDAGAKTYSGGVKLTRDDLLALRDAIYASATTAGAAAKWAPSAPAVAAADVLHYDPAHVKGWSWNKVPATYLSDWEDKYSTEQVARAFGVPYDPSGTQTLAGIVQANGTNFGYETFGPADIFVSLDMYKGSSITVLRAMAGNPNATGVLQVIASATAEMLPYGQAVPMRLDARLLKQVPDLMALAPYGKLDKLGLTFDDVTALGKDLLDGKPPSLLSGVIPTVTPIPTAKVPAPDWTWQQVMTDTGAKRVPGLEAGFSPNYFHFEDVGPGFGLRDEVNGELTGVWMPGDLVWVNPSYHATFGLPIDAADNTAYDLRKEAVKRGLITDPGKNVMPPPTAFGGKAVPDQSIANLDQLLAAVKPVDATGTPPPLPPAAPIPSVHSTVTTSIHDDLSMNSVATGALYVTVTPQKQGFTKYEWMRPEWTKPVAIRMRTLKDTLVISNVSGDPLSVQHALLRHVSHIAQDPANTGKALRIDVALPTPLTDELLLYGSQGPSGAITILSPDWHALASDVTSEMGAGPSATTLATPAQGNDLLMAVGVTQAEYDEFDSILKFKTEALGPGGETMKWQWNGGATTYHTTVGGQVTYVGLASDASGDPHATAESLVHLTNAATIASKKGQTLSVAETAVDQLPGLEDALLAAGYKKNITGGWAFTPDQATDLIHALTYDKPLNPIAGVSPAPLPKMSTQFGYDIDVLNGAVTSGSFAGSTGGITVQMLGGSKEVFWTLDAVDTIRLNGLDTASKEMQFVMALKALQHWDQFAPMDAKVVVGSAFDQPILDMALAARGVPYTYKGYSDGVLLDHNAVKWLLHKADADEALPSLATGSAAGATVGLPPDPYALLGVAPVDEIAQIADGISIPTTVSADFMVGTVFDANGLVTPNGVGLNSLKVTSGYLVSPEAAKEAIAAVVYKAAKATADLPNPKATLLIDVEKFPLEAELSKMLAAFGGDPGALKVSVLTQKNASALADALQAQMKPIPPKVSIGIPVPTNPLNVDPGVISGSQLVKTWSGDDGVWGSLGYHLTGADLVASGYIPSMPVEKQMAVMADLGAYALAHKSGLLIDDTLKSGLGPGAHLAVTNHAVWVPSAKSWAIKKEDLPDFLAALGGKPYDTLGIPGAQVLPTPPLFYGQPTATVASTGNAHGILAFEYDTNPYGPPGVIVTNAAFDDNTAAVDALGELVDWGSKNQHPIWLAPDAYKSLGLDPATVDPVSISKYTDKTGAMHDLIWVDADTVVAMATPAVTTPAAPTSLLGVSAGDLKAIGEPTETAMAQGFVKYEWTAPGEQILRFRASNTTLTVASLKVATDGDAAVDNLVRNSVLLDTVRKFDDRILGTPSIELVRIPMSQTTKEFDDLLTNLGFTHQMLPNGAGDEWRVTADQWHTLRAQVDATFAGTVVPGTPAGAVNTQAPVAASPQTQPWHHQQGWHIGNLDQTVQASEYDQSGNWWVHTTDATTYYKAPNADYDPAAAKYTPNANPLVQYTMHWKHQKKGILWTSAQKQWDYTGGLGDRADPALWQHLYHLAQTAKADGVQLWVSDNMLAKSEALTKTLKSVGAKSKHFANYGDGVFLKGKQIDDLLALMDNAVSPQPGFVMPKGIVTPPVTAATPPLSPATPSPTVVVPPPPAPKPLDLGDIYGYDHAVVEKWDMPTDTVVNETPITRVVSSAFPTGTVTWAEELQGKARILRIRKAEGATDTTAQLVGMMRALATHPDHYTTLNGGLTKGLPERVLIEKKALADAPGMTNILFDSKTWKETKDYWVINLNDFGIFADDLADGNPSWMAKVAAPSAAGTPTAAPITGVQGAAIAGPLTAPAKPTPAFLYGYDPAAVAQPPTHIGKGMTEVVQKAGKSTEERDVWEMNGVKGYWSVSQTGARAGLWRLEAPTTATFEQKRDAAFAMLRQLAQDAPQPKGIFVKPEFYDQVPGLRQLILDAGGVEADWGTVGTAVAMDGASATKLADALRTNTMGSITPGFKTTSEYLGYSDAAIKAVVAQEPVVKGASFTWRIETGPGKKVPVAMNVEGSADWSRAVIKGFGAGHTDVTAPITFAAQLNWLAENGAQTIEVGREVLERLPVTRQWLLAIGGTVDGAVIRLDADAVSAARRAIAKDALPVPLGGAPLPYSIVDELNANADTVADALTHHVIAPSGNSMSSAFTLQKGVTIWAGYTESATNIHWRTLDRRTGTVGDARAAAAAQLRVFANRLAQHANIERLEVSDEVVAQMPGMRNVLRKYGAKQQGADGIWTLERPQALRLRKDLEAEWKAFDDLTGLNPLEQKAGVVMWPATDDLTQTAKSVGGQSKKGVYVDKDGNEWLFKPGYSGRGMVTDVTAFELAKMLGLPLPPVRAYSLNFNGKVVDGSLQKMVPGQGFKTIDQMTPGQIEQVVRHTVLDWVMGNDDAHIGNWIVDKDGTLWAIDKTRAFKAWKGPNDVLDATSLGQGGTQAMAPTINNFWLSVRRDPSKLAAIHPTTISATLRKLNAISDEDYARLMRPVAEKTEHPRYKGKPEVLLKEMLERKHTAADDLEAFFRKEVGIAVKADPNKVPREWAEWYKRGGKFNLNATPKDLMEEHFAELTSKYGDPRAGTPGGFTPARYQHLIQTLQLKEAAAVMDEFVDGGLKHYSAGAVIGGNSYVKGGGQIKVTPEMAARVRGVPPEGSFAPNFIPLLAPQQQYEQWLELQQWALLSIVHGADGPRGTRFDAMARKMWDEETASFYVNRGSGRFSTPRAAWDDLVKSQVKAAKSYGTFDSSWAGGGQVTHALLHYTQFITTNATDITRGEEEWIARDIRPENVIRIVRGRRMSRAELEAWRAAGKNPWD